MAKIQTRYICSSCGSVFERWQGKCSQCGEWNTLTETTMNVSKKSHGKIISRPEILGKTPQRDFSRMQTSIAEFDRVVGEGIVPGSLILLGGDPGIGKSTLILQIASKISDKEKVLYVSGEESAHQVGMRSERLGAKSSSLYILPETDIDAICESIKGEKPSFVIIDSIQTMFSRDVMSVAGSVAQVSLCSQKLMEVAKREHIAIVIIGHVTKDGNIAGPRLLEHLVDVVLYLEGDRYGGFRILRGIKNRFGSTNETGMFEMKDNGLIEVKNPSQAMLSERADNVSGTAVFATMEGTRPLLVEIQALTSVTSFGYPKRTVSGMDLNRLQLIIAVLAKRANINLSNQDVFVNVVGGMSVREPAMDLAVVMAIVSAYKNKPIKRDVVVFGEIGLAGEVRSVDNVDRRVNEAQKLGFKSVILPKVSKLSLAKGVSLVKVSSIKGAIEATLQK